MEKYIEKNGITYELRGEQYYPLLELPEQKEIGRWGLLHLGYLKRFAVARYNELLISGELNTYLYKLNEELVYNENAESDRTVTLGDVVIYLFFEYENAT